MKNKIFATLIVASQILLLSQLPSDAASKFPGKGNKKDWVKATRTYDQAIALRKKNDIDGAIKLYEEAIKIYPYDGDLYLNLAVHCARDKKNFARAEELINKAVELNPDNYELQWERAVILIDQNKVAEAKVVLEQAQKLKKTDDQAKELANVLKQVNEALAPSAANAK